MAVDAIPDELLDDAIASMSTPDVTPMLVRHSGGPYAGIELYLPSAIGIFIASSYFGGFFKKAGEDHYVALREAAKLLWKRAAALRVSRTATTGKLTDTPYSVAYSITGDLTDSLRFKFILKMDIPEEDASLAITSFLSFLEDFHLGRLDENAMRALLSYEPSAGTVLVTYDPQAGELVPVDPFEEAPYKTSAQPTR